jgi:hypothetical protein
LICHDHRMNEIQQLISFFLISYVQVVTSQQDVHAVTDALTVQ